MKQLLGDKLGASDGKIGQVKDFYFDDQNWAIRYLVFIRGRIRAENRNPASRLLAWAYRPLVNLVLRFKCLTLLLALAVLAITWFPLSRIGSEFMPPLNEGTLLFMPTSVPGISITEANRSKAKVGP